MAETNRFQIGILIVVLIAAILSGATLYLVAVKEQDSNGDSGVKGHIEIKEQDSNGDSGVKGHIEIKEQDSNGDSGVKGHIEIKEQDSNGDSGVKGHIEIREQEPNGDSGVKDHVHSEEPQTNCEHSDDVAIIGAGIAGSYAAWRLREAGLKITLYEYSDRIGGRCHTVKFPDIPDINVELGAMRFYPSVHVMLNKTISDLGLETTEFLPHNTDTLYYFRGRHMNKQQLIDNPPYSLKPEHKKSPGTIDWEIFANYTNVNSSVPGYLDAPNIFQYKTTDGVPLYQQSHKSFAGKYLYPELSAFLKDVSGYSSSYQDVSAAKSIPTGDPTIPVTTKSADFHTVVGGFQSIPETMVKQFIQSSNMHSYKPNHHLKSIKKLEDGQYKLSFQQTKTVRGVTRDKVSDRVNVCAKTVMLAIPRLALEHLDWDVLKGPTTADYIKNALYEAKAGKMFFAYDNPWWRNVVNTAPMVCSTTPLRVTYDFGVSNSSGMAVLNPAYKYTNTRIWRNTVTQGQPVPGVNDDTIQLTDVSQNMARKYLAQIYGISVSDVPQPKYSVMRIWDEYPIGASWYHYRAGYIWTEVEDHMLKPSDVDDVYVISNTFSSTGSQSWVEGALEIVDKMLKKRFPGF